jgi:hypothetical protein
MKKYSITDLLHSAEINDGKCLSKEYRDLNTHVEWKCKEGHRFSMGYVFVKQGAWCPQCIKEEQKQIKLEKYQNYAQRHGGKCLTKKYVSASEKTKWECGKGHVWKQAFRYIKLYGWCRLCQKEERNNKIFLKAKSAAEKKGGKCLTEKYFSSHQKMEWQCEHGHTWKTQPTHILNNHSWCPACSGKARHTIDQMYTLAKLRGGVCLSAEYKNNHLKLTWRCDKDHIWKAGAGKIVSGQWCPVCRYDRVAEKLRADIGELKKLAKSKGGELLSKEYVNALTPVKWKCKQGHEWSARYADVKHHSWCPVCAH